MTIGQKRILTAILLILVLSIAIFFRLKGLAIRDVWYDEALGIIQAEKTIAEINKDVPTPIHYYFVHFFLQFGKNTLVLGLPSVIFGVASIYLLYLIGQKISRPNLGLVAAFLLAISPMHIEFSQQILHYSYFVFFTLLSLYFYLDFLFILNNKKFKWSSFLFFILFTIINFLTHVSSFLVFAIEVVYLVFSLAKNYKLVKNYKKYSLFLIVAFLVVFSLVVVNLSEGHYLELILSSFKLGSRAPIQLGYSLSKQLGTITLPFNKSFFIAMLSWFGLGKGIPLDLYLFLFILGIISFIRKRKFNIILFSLVWISFPFIFLYTVGLAHWFEEKYFIFIIPIYLLVISEGIIFLSKIFSQIIFYFYKPKRMLEVMQQAFQLGTLSLVFWLALTPIQIRSTYGFPVQGDTKYSWRQVYSYLKENMKENDRVFVRRGEGLFLSFYLEKAAKDKIWFEEDYILRLSPKQYLAFARDNGVNYFISIPEFYDTFLSTITDYQFIAKAGNHNIYTIKFKKESPFKVKENPKGQWEYYDDFATARYFAEAYEWMNVLSTYIGNYNLPMTYGFYNLSPSSVSDTWLKYHFLFPYPVKSFFIKPVFFITKGVSFKILLGDSEENLKEVYSNNSDSFSFFNPLIKIENNFYPSRNLFVKICFIVDKDRLESLEQVGLKSFWIFNWMDEGVKDYKVIPINDRLNYYYKSDLEVTKSHKWLYHTITNDGWIQATDGILLRLYGTSEENPLIYKFVFKQPPETIDLELKTYVFDNKLDVYARFDNHSWFLLEEIKDDNDIKIHHLRLANLRTKDKTFFLKLVCEKKGPTCQLRELHLNAEVVK